MTGIFVTDCEGPISKNDNAFELTQKIIPEGKKLFALISKYDDIQVEIVKRLGYRPGNTLKLILPFLKAYSATNDILRRLSAEGIMLIKGAKELLSLVKMEMPSFIVSTSYEYYVQSLCRLTGFPEDHVYCTKLDLDRFTISEQESVRLKKMTKEMVELPMLSIPTNANSLSDLGIEDRKTVKFLDEIFWKEIPQMSIGSILREVIPIGGAEKVESVKDLVKKNYSDTGQVIYFGDSITDSEPLKYVRENGGLAVSFNGNEYAIREAEIAILADNNLVIAIFAMAFKIGGKKAVESLVNNWNYRSLAKVLGNEFDLKIEKTYGDKLPYVMIISEHNKERLILESCSFRKKVRGETVGSLG